MHIKSENTLQKTTQFASIISTLFGIVVLPVGLINVFWGNDAAFGIFLILLACLYFPPAHNLLWKRFRFPIPLVIKILMGTFIVIAAMGVGELPAKIDMMLEDLG